MTAHIAVTVTVYCEGGYHQPLQFTFQHSPTKGEISAQVRSAGWKITPTGGHFCPEHKK